MITYTATDPSGNTGTGVRFIHVTDNTPPYANLYTTQTIDTTPFLQGYINDPTATIEVTIEGRTYTGVNTGTGNYDIGSYDGVSTTVIFTTRWTFPVTARCRASGICAPISMPISAAMTCLANACSMLARPTAS